MQTTPPASTQIVESPNAFYLTGDGLSIRYATTSLDGRPILVFHDRAGERIFRGDEVDAELTEIGSLVTVILSRGREGGSSKFSVLIPMINLVGGHHLRTFGVTTLTSPTWVHPDVSVGQAASYHVVHLAGTAAQVEP